MPLKRARDSSLDRAVRRRDPLRRGVGARGLCVSPCLFVSACHGLSFHLIPAGPLLCSLTHDAARAVHAAASPAPFAKPRPWGPWAKTWTACGTSWAASEAASRYVCSGGTYSSSAMCQRKNGGEER